MIGTPPGEHLLGGGDQNRAAVHHKEIRAFPHTAVFIAASVQHRFHLPVQGIFAAVQKDGAAAVQSAVGYNRIKAVFLFIPPDLGVPEIHSASALRQIRRGQYRIILIFFIVSSIAEGNTLHLAALNKAVLSLLFPDTGIHKDLTSVRQLSRASGKASRVVILFIRCDRSRQPLPANQVFCLHMSPVHGAPAGIIWIVLIKKVIFPFINRKPIGVIHPAYSRHHMKQRPVSFRDPVSVNFLIIPCLLQFRIHEHLPSKYFFNFILRGSRKDVN